MSADWAEKPEAVPYSDLDDPQSLNLYSYVRNIPTAKADSDGHQTAQQAVDWVLINPKTVAVIAAVADKVSSALMAVGSAVSKVGTTAGGTVLLVGSYLISPGSGGANNSNDTLDGVKATLATNLAVQINEMTRAGKSTEQLRREWEKLTGQKWPSDPNTGKNQDAHHKEPKADGGVDAGTNIELLPHDAHVDHHKKRGDFKRWGSRAPKHSGQQPQPKPDPPKPDPPKQDPPK